MPVHRAPVPSARPAGQRPLGVITTGRLEERVWRRFGPGGAILKVTAGSEAGAAAALQEVLEAGVSGLVSFGVAAGLAPAARPGRLVLADAITLPGGGSRPTDAAWREDLLGRLGSRGLMPLVARIAGAAAIPGCPLERSARFRVSVAAALDTESHLIAEAAHVRRLPFVALRVVIDEAGRPSLGTDLLTMTSAARWRRGVASGLLRPWQVTRVVRAARDLELGLQVLARALPALVAPQTGLVSDVDP